MPVASASGVMLDLDVLKCGNCEELKLGVHAGALTLAAVCGVYNAAAWVVRRERHLAVNALLYMMLVAWEQKHIAQHLQEIRQLSGAGPVAGPDAPSTSLAA